MHRASIICATVAVALFVCGAARAQVTNPVLLYCDDDDIAAVPGTCSGIAAAIQNELGDFYLEIVHINELVQRPESGEHVSDAIAQRTQAEGAIFAVWFTKSEFEPGSLLTLHVYDPGIDQTISRTMPSFGGEGAIHYPDIAFHARIIMGASLYSDLDEIVDDENLMALAVPPERVDVIQARPRVRKNWVSLNVGYLFTGYPTVTNWYHGIAFDAAVLPIPRLELFLDMGFLFLQERVEVFEPVYASLDSRQFLIGIGARYDVIGHERIALLPGAGLHIGVSATDVTGDVRKHHRSAHPAIWAGVEVRVHIAKRVWAATGLRFENLFKYERVFLGETSMIFKLSQFRFSVHAVISVAI